MNETLELVGEEWRNRKMAVPDLGVFCELNGIASSEAIESLKEVFRECPYRWAEIRPWLNRKRMPSRADEAPATVAWVCPFCGKPMKWIYWENKTPPNLLCGRGGWVEICRTCKWWGRYEMRWMS